MKLTFRGHRIYSSIRLDETSTMVPTGCFRKNDFFFKLVLMTLFYVRMYTNSTKSESPHYDI